MSTSRIIVIAVSLASSAILTAWLLTGGRKEKTKEFVARKAENFKSTLRQEKFRGTDDQEFYYI
ncbi:MAG: hypothetical protein WKF87_21300 [Chryseolinea sp.]